MHAEAPATTTVKAASTLVTLDFYKKWRPNATERNLVTFGRAATGIMVLLGLLWVPFIHLISSQLYIYLQSVQAYISPPIAACFILGILWPRLNGAGALSSLLTGFGLGHLLHYGRELNAMDQVIGIMLVIVLIGLLADKTLFSPWERFLHRRWGTGRT